MRPKLISLLAANAKRGEFRAEANVIYLYDFIVSSAEEASWFGGVSAEEIAKALSQMSGDVTLRINSPGGDAFAGVAIAQAIRGYSGKVVTVVDGLAASAASTVAIAGDQVLMAPGAMMMIHNSWTIALGDRHDFADTAALLEKIDGEIAVGYAKKAGGEVAAFAAMMDKETWLTADEAITAGLADDHTPEPEKAKAKACARTWDLAAFDHAPTLAELSAIEPEPVDAVIPEPVAPEISDAAQSEQRIRQLTARLLAPAA